MESGVDYYQILGVPFDATPDEIRNAYFTAAKRMHPDANPQENSAESFLQVQQAYDVLNNFQKRAYYDSSLPHDSFSRLLSVNIKYSRSVLPVLNEPQLVYALVELICKAELTRESVPLTYTCLVIDRSTSMEGERMDIVKKSVVRLLKTMKPTDNICIITFSDRAEVLIQPTQAVNVNRLEYEISLIRTGGGTEIYQGIDLGSIQLRRLARVNAIKQLILLTDGHTYGDEEKCYNLARECARNGIKINALGIGHEWNDVFLDQLTGLSGGTTSLALSSEDLPKLFEQLVGLTQTIFARELKYEFLTPTYVKPCYAFRISPECGPVPISAPLYLGNVNYDSKISFIFEFLIDKIPKNMDFIHLANGYLTMNLPGTRSAKYYLDLSRKTTVNHIPEIPSNLIIHALSRLALYRLQERAQNEVKHGDYKQASKHLQHLATHLLSQGDRELAHTVLLEAEHIHQTNGFSKSGDKRIKYGTRSLIIPRAGVK